MQNLPFAKIAATIGGTGLAASAVWLNAEHIAAAEGWHSMTSDIISLRGARIQTRAIRSTAKALQVSIKVLQSLEAARPIAEELVTAKELADDLLDDISTLDDRLLDSLEPGTAPASD